MTCPASRSGAVLFISHVKSLPSLTSALAVAVDRASVWSYRGSQGPRLFQQDIIQFFVDMLRRNERDVTTSSSSLHDSSSGSRHGPWSCNHDFRLNELRAAKEPRSRLACCPFRANNFHLRSLHDSTSGIRPTFLTSPCSQNTARAQSEHN
jgi:hypothetical protein